jgi:hypothetical protein
MKGRQKGRNIKAEILAILQETPDMPGKDIAAKVGCTMAMVSYTRREIKRKAAPVEVAE